MSKDSEVFQRVLIGVGVAGVLIGLVTIVFAIGFIGPRVSSLTEEFTQTLAIAEDGLSVLEGTAAAFEASPDVLEHMKATMRQSATALRSTAVTMREVGGPIGLVVPEEALEESASQLEGTATELERLAEDVGGIQDAGSAMDLPSIRMVLADLRSQMGDNEEALSRAPAARGVVVLAVLQGGLYMLLGALALALAGLMGNIERLARPNDSRGHA